MWAFYDKYGQKRAFVVGVTQKVTTSPLAGGPPASPADGDIWIASGVTASGERWHFQYNAGSASSYKWEFIGGSETFGASGQSVYSALSSGTTAQPPIFIAPRDGDYDIWGGAQFTGPTASSYVSLAVGAPGNTGPGNTQSIPVSNQHISIETAYRALNVPAGAQFSLFTTASHTDLSSANRWMKVRPVRIA
jgi:hypothetical protein